MPRTAFACCGSRRAAIAIWSPSSATPPHLRRRMDHRIGRMGQRPHPWPAVQGALHAHLGADLHRRHREIPRLRHDPRHRAGLCQEAGQGVRREGVRHHRGRARSAARGDRHWPGARQAHHRRLGRAEDRARDHGLPAQPWRRHGTGGPHLQDLWRRCRPGHDREPLSAGARHPRHRLQDRRRDRHEARHREDGDDPGARRDLLCADRGDGRRSLRLAHRGTGAAGRRAAGGPEGAGPDRARSRTGRGHGDRRHGRRDGLRLPRRPLSGRAGHRRAAAAPGQRQRCPGPTSTRRRRCPGSSRRPACRWPKARSRRSGWPCCRRSWSSPAARAWARPPSSTRSCAFWRPRA